MQVLMSGSSGFLGTALTQHLRTQGHEVIRLIRRPAQEPDERRWDPYAEVLELGTPDAVINLCGTSVARRWTENHKQKFASSRIEPTAVLARGIAKAAHKPKVMLNASGIGYYGDTGDQLVTEDDKPGKDFLAELCGAWEAATRPAEDAGTRTVHMRNGLVLDPAGGMLKPILPLFRLGVGGRLGSGGQYMAWIALTDWLGAVSHLLEAEVSGPVNMCAPHPVTNEEFTKALAGELHRPSFMAVPEFALRTALGEFSDQMLGGQRAMPAVLMESGYTFSRPELEEALHEMLSR